MDPNLTPKETSVNHSFVFQANGNGTVTPSNFAFGSATTMAHHPQSQSRSRKRSPEPENDSGKVVSDTNNTNNSGEKVRLVPFADSAVRRMLEEKEDVVQKLRDRLQAEKTARAGLEKVAQQLQQQLKGEVTSSNSTIAGSTSEAHRNLKLMTDLNSKDITIESLTALNKALQNNVRELKVDASNQSQRQKNQESDNIRLRKELVQQKKHAHRLAMRNVFRSLNPNRRWTKSITTAKQNLNLNFRRHAHHSIPVKVLQKESALEDALKEEFKKTISGLEIEHRALQAIAENDKKKIEDLEISVQSLKNCIQEMEGSSKTDTNGLKKKIKDLESTIEMLQEKRGQESLTKSQGEAMKLELEAAKAKRREQDARIQALQSGVHALQGEKKSIEAEVAAEKKKVETLYSEKREHEATIRYLRTEKSKIEVDREELQKLQEEKKDHNDLEKEVQELKRTIEILQQDKETLNNHAKSQRDSVQSELEAVQTKKKEHEQTIVTLQKEIRLLRTNAATEKPKTEAEREELEKLRAEKKNHNDAEKKVQELKNTIVALQKGKQEFQDLAKKLQEERKDHNELEKEIQDLQQAVETLQKDKKTLEDHAKFQSDSLQSELEAVRAKKKEHEQMIASLQKEIRSLRTDAAAEKPKIEAEREELQQLREQKENYNGLEKRVQEFQCTIDTLKKDKQTLEDHAKSQSDSVQSGLEAVRKEHEKTIATLQNENRSLRTDAITDRAKIEAELWVLQEEKKTYLEEEASRCAAFQKTINNLESTVTSKASEISNLKKTVEKLNSTIQGTPPLAQRDQNELQRLNREKDLLEDIAKSFQERLRKCEAETVPMAKLMAKTTELVKLQQGNGSELSGLNGENQKLKQTVAALQEQRDQEARSNGLKQGRINSLEMEVSSLKQEREKYKHQESTGQYPNNTSLLHSKIEALAIERDKYKEMHDTHICGSEFAQAKIRELQSERDQYKDAAHSRAAGFGFISQSGKNRSLSSVNVTAELRYAQEQFPSYRLGKPLKPPGGGSSRTPGKNPNNRSSTQNFSHPSSSRALSRGPWENMKSSPYVKRQTFFEPRSDDPMTDEELPGQRSSQKKTGKARVVELSSDSDQSTDDESSASGDDIDESDISHTAARYARKGSRSSWTPAAQRKQVNKLSRSIIRELLGARKNYKAFICPNVPADRKISFEQTQENGPKIRNTFIDKNAASTKSMLSLPWNQQLVYLAATTAERIVANCEDERFGPAIDWIDLMTERLYRICLDVIKSRPQTVEGTVESPQQVKDRLVDRYMKRIKSNAETNIRHVKWRARSEICAIMIKICEQRDDSDGARFFRFLLRVITEMQSGGQSEEEDGVDTVKIGERELTEPVKFVKELKHRHPLLTKVAEFLGKVPGFEKLHSVQSVRPCKRRIRGDSRCKVSNRPPPQGWPASFFADGYLEALPGYERAKLRVSRNDFPLYEIEVEFNRYTSNT